jgi:hypothetical protein
MGKVPQRTGSLRRRDLLRWPVVSRCSEIFKENTGVHRRRLEHAGDVVWVDALPRTQATAALSTKQARLQKPSSAATFYFWNSCCRRRVQGWTQTTLGSHCAAVLQRFTVHVCPGDLLFLYVRCRQCGSRQLRASRLSCRARRGGTPPTGGGGSSSSSVPKRSMLGRRSCQCQYPFATGIVEWATCRVTADTAASARSRMTTVAFCKEAFAFDMRSQPDVAARRRQMGQDGRSQRLQSCQRQSLTQREFYRASAHGGSMLSRF